MDNRDLVEQLFATYAYAIDTREFELLHGVFTKDATFVVSIEDGDTYPFEGRDYLVSFIGETTLAQTDRRRHVITNIRVDGEERATAYLSLVVVDGGALTVKSTGIYTATLAREDGALRFATLGLHLLLPF
jgi:hypothetical protein